MGFSLDDFHERHRSAIIREWVLKLKTEVGELYVRRPRRELMDTVSGAFDANREMLVRGDFGPINRFIDRITRMRLETGFLLSDVQRAFELYRIIVIPLLARETSREEFLDALCRINDCLTYTIQRFSIHFQNMHEKKILEHNRRLEEEVRARTSQLRESERKYKTLVEEITDGYFVIQDEVIVFANRAFCRMHGRSIEEIVGRKFYSFVRPEDRDRVNDIYRRSLTTRSAPRSLEYMRLDRDGDCFPTEILAKTTVFDNRLSSIGICRDITERVRMEKRMLEAERMAYVGEITTSLSHEIRNPLAAVTLNLKLLTKTPRIQGNDLRRLNISAREVVRLERILNELLDFAKPLQLQYAVTRINPLVRSCVELLEAKFRENGLSLVTRLEKGIPDVRADGEKLEQALINLLLNAVEASGREGEIRVTTAYVPDGGSPRTEISVLDRGRGLPEAALSDLFKPFFTTKTKGSGLGLNNVKRIVEGHGGWVEARNRRSRGASFTICLPGENGHVQDTGR
ncbi:MAG: PAS domain S-box protein [Deltaproteobacteria bacterium]|nr:PAS domain S-box protein [Deltaproteobacteria bacterium]